MLGENSGGTKSRGSTLLRRSLRGGKAGTDCGALRTGERLGLPLLITSLTGLSRVGVCACSALVISASFDPEESKLVFDEAAEYRALWLRLWLFKFEPLPRIGVKWPSGLFDRGRSGGGAIASELTRRDLAGCSDVPSNVVQ